MSSILQNILSLFVSVAVSATAAAAAGVMLISFRVLGSSRRRNHFQRLRNQLKTHEVAGLRDLLGRLLNETPERRGENSGRYALMSRR